MSAGVDVVALKGGLGNQLFQWAFGLGLADRGSRVKYDAGLIREPVTLEIDRLVAGHGTTTLPSTTHRVLGRVGAAGLSPWKWVRERGFRYDPELVDGLRGWSFIEGYWQSPRYFESVESSVRSTLLEWGWDELTDVGVELHARISSAPDACSIHVRRGDYVSNPTASAHHGVLDLDYYRRAVQAATDAGARRFFVFTNDHDWVRDELDLPGAFVVPRSVARSPMGEIGLMAACAHHVVANSSFSWWGAWLGEDPNDDRDGTTVAPERWFADPSLDTSDLVPAHWVRIAN